MTVVKVSKVKWRADRKRSMKWTVQAYTDNGVHWEFENFEDAIAKAVLLRDQGLMVYFHAPAAATDEQLQAFVDLFGHDLSLTSSGLAHTASDGRDRSEA